MPRARFVDVAGHRLECVRIGGAQRTDTGLPARGSWLGRAVEGFPRARGRCDRLPCAGLFARRLRTLVAGIAAAYGRLHARRGADGAAGAARPARIAIRYWSDTATARRSRYCTPARSRPCALWSHSRRTCSSRFRSRASPRCDGNSRRPIFATGWRDVTPIRMPRFAAGTTSGCRRRFALEHRGGLPNVRCPLLMIQGSTTSTESTSSTRSNARPGQVRGSSSPIAATRRTATSRKRRWRRSSISRLD